MTLTEINNSLSLLQDERGLTFGSDAYLLAAYVRRCTGGRAADLGSGTGIIPLLCLSSGKFSSAHAIEIQESFADIIAKNAALNGFEHSLFPVCADIREIKALPLGGEFDIVTANPPYMKTDSGKRNTNDEKFIARHEVCGGVDDFCAAAWRLLKHGGRFYCVWRPDRLCDLLVALRANRLEPKLMTFVRATCESEPSMILVNAAKGAASGCRITKDLILHSSREDAAASILSPDARSVYDGCSFDKFFEACRVK